jgi:hypothetical protein
MTSRICRRIESRLSSAPMRPTRPIRGQSAKDTRRRQRSPTQDVHDRGSLLGNWFLPYCCTSIPLACTHSLICNKPTWERKQMTSPFLLLRAILMHRQQQRFFGDALSIQFFFQCCSAWISDHRGTTHDDVRDFVINEKEPLKVRLFGVFGVHAQPGVGERAPMLVASTSNTSDEITSSSTQLWVSSEANKMKRQPFAPHHSPFTVERSLLTTHSSLLTADDSLLTNDDSHPTTHCSRLTGHPSLFTAHSRRVRSDCLRLSRRRKPPIMAQDYVGPLRPQLCLRHTMVANSVYIRKPLSRDLTTIMTFEGGHITFRLTLLPLVITTYKA